MHGFIRIITGKKRKGGKWNECVKISILALYIACHAGGKQLIRTAKGSTQTQNVLCDKGGRTRQRFRLKEVIIVLIRWLKNKRNIYFLKKNLKVYLKAPTATWLGYF